MSGVDAGSLTQRITVNRSAEVSDGKGGFDDAWTPIAKVWASVTSLNGREAVIAQALQGVSSYRIVVRFGVDIQTTDQIVYQGKTLNVRSVDDPDGRRGSLVIYADTSNAQAMT